MQLIHGGDIVGSKARYPGKEFLDFSANINPMGIPEKVRVAFVESLPRCEEYPDPLCRELTAALADYEGVPPECILCGAGAADILYRVASALRPGRALLLAPTFAEYELALRHAGFAVKLFALQEEASFLPGEDLLQAVDGVNLVVVCNPNNPTGALMPQDLFCALAEKCMARGVALMIDECFLDFLPEPDIYSLKCRLHEGGQLVLLKAFTKIFAIPGIRLGYGLFSDEALRERCTKAGPPWNVSIPAQCCGVAAIKEIDYLHETRKNIPLWRAGLERDLARLDCKVYPSAANYILFRHQRNDLREELERRGILIRDCSNYHGLASGYYRVAVRMPEENRRLIGTMEALR